MHVAAPYILRTVADSNFMLVPAAANSAVMQANNADQQSRRRLLFRIASESFRVLRLSGEQLVNGSFDFRDCVADAASGFAGRWPYVVCDTR